MKSLLRLGLVAFGLLLAAPAWAASGTIFMDTGGATTNSGTTDTNAATLSGTAATLVTSTTAVTLDTNTNIGTVAGCSAGTCDGSQAIFITNATNANRKIFWILSYTGCTGTGACVLTVDTAVTCATCTAQNWAIGGRMIFTPANYEAALRAGDTVTLNNSPATQTAAFLVSRVAGDSTTGPITFQGKVGVRPLLNITSGTGVPILITNNNWIIRNIEIQQNGTVAACLSINSATNVIVDNVKISKCPGNGITGANNPIKVFGSEITAAGGDAMNTSNSFVANGNYIHGNTGSGIVISIVSPAGALINNIIASNSAKGIYLSGASANLGAPIIIAQNTIYSNTTAGLEVANVNTAVTLINNVFVNDGTHANVIWDAGTAELATYHNYNTYYASGGTNLTGLTPNSTELTSNPLLNNPGSGDFTLQAASPALGAGFPGAFITATAGHLSMGAAQSPAGTSGGHIIGG